MEFSNDSELNEMIVISNNEYNEYKLFKDKQINKELVKKQLLKQYKYEYFVLNRKQTFEHCLCCNVDIKMNSVFNHNISKKHILNFDKYNLI